MLLLATIPILGASLLPDDGEDTQNPADNATATTPAMDQANAPVEETPADVPPGNSDWEPPAGPVLNNSDTQQPEANSQATPPPGLPTLEARGVSGDGSDGGGDTDTSATDAAAEQELAPRVDIGGPGTPKWKIIYYVNERTTVDNNIYISHDNRKSDVYFTLSPGFAAGWGDFRQALFLNTNRFSDEFGQTRQDILDPQQDNYAYLNYTASATAFITNTSQDALDHDLSLAGQWGFSKVLLGFTARFQTLSGPDVDVGTRTKRDIFTLGSTARYSLSDKTSLEMDLSGVDRQYRTELNSSEWEDQAWLDYQAFPKTNIGAGVAVGMRYLESNPDQLYEQAQLRAEYDMTGRLIIRANGGLEFDEADGSDRLNPVFGIGITYVLDDQDSFDLSASRQTSSSAVTSGQTEDITGIDIEFKHRIYSNFSIALQVGYDHSEYYGGGGLTEETRTDNYLFVRPSLIYDFARWSQIELAYEFHDDMSTVEDYAFTESLASLQFNFVF